MKSNIHIKICLLILLFLSNVSIISNGELPLSEIENRNFEAQRTIYYYQIRDLPFSEELLIKCLYYEKIIYPEIVLTQARLETGFYTSDIFKNGNNLFGMKYPKYRTTTATGTYQGHAQYSHWIESVIDYRKFQDWYMSLGYRITGTEIDEYLVFLQWIKYAEDPHYIPKIVKLGFET
jgi:hypothetical protein